MISMLDYATLYMAISNHAHFYETIYFLKEPV